MEAAVRAAIAAATRARSGVNSSRAPRPTTSARLGVPGCTSVAFL